MSTVAYAATNQTTDSQSEGVFNLNEAESFVLEAVSEGKPADLIEAFGDEEDARTIRAKFLCLLLTNKSKKAYPTSNSITIKGAIINDPLEITNQNVGTSISFLKCTFNSYINFYGTQFDGYLQFIDDCSFSDDVILNAISVRDCLVLDNAIFYQKLALSAANIEGQFNANALKCKNTDVTVSFYGINVGKSASFKNAEFNGGVDFTNAKIGIDLLADEVKFQSKNLKILFDGVAINGGFSLVSARCDSQASFGTINIGMILNASEAKFKSPHKIDFSLTQTKILFLNGAYFAGPVVFAGCNITETLIINSPSGFDVKLTNQTTTFKKDVFLLEQLLNCWWLFSLNLKVKQFLIT